MSIYVGVDNKAVQICPKYFLSTLTFEQAYADSRPFQGQFVVNVVGKKKSVNSARFN